MFTVLTQEVLLQKFHLHGASLEELLVYLKDLSANAETWAENRVKWYECAHFDVVRLCTKEQQTYELFKFEKSIATHKCLTNNVC